MTRLFLDTNQRFRRRHAILPALKAKVDVIITRNGKDFAASKIPIMTATEYLASIE